MQVIMTCVEPLMDVGVEWMFHQPTAIDSPYSVRISVTPFDSLYQLRFQGKGVGYSLDS
jgi:hypothetical protein